MLKHAIPMEVARDIWCASETGINVIVFFLFLVSEIMAVSDCKGNGIFDLVKMILNPESCSQDSHREDTRVESDLPISNSPGREVHGDL